MKLIEISQPVRENPVALFTLYTNTPTGAVRPFYPMRSSMRVTQQYTSIT
jgi:hypothetical protein